MTLQPVKIYFPEQLLDGNQRHSWFELIKSKDRFTRKVDDLDQRIQSMLIWVDDPYEAQLWILPMDWRYYAENGQMQLALKFCLEAEERGKTVWSFNGGDYGIELQINPCVRIYRMSYNRSELKSTDKIMPFFLSDPVKQVLGAYDESMLFSKRTPDELVVGFCGMAPHGLIIYLREWFLVAIQSAKRYLSSPRVCVQPWLSTSNLRYRSMQAFKNASNWKTDFIVHKKHRAGAVLEEEIKVSTQRYYGHMLGSDLIICVRGAGNFSVRFYETLAMGRIPVFVDTDSPLPDIRDKDWNDYMIVVDQKNIDKAPEIVANWLKKKDLLKQKKKNRMLWVEHFRIDNFWINELNGLDKTLHED